MKRTMLKSKSIARSCAHNEILNIDSEVATLLGASTVA